MLKKNKIEGLKNTIKKIKNDKDKIEQKINLVIKELEEKLLFINNLKKKFFECLSMKIQFVELILNNYEKKLENYNINYFIANNLEKQINFNLLELNINKNSSLDKKIQNISDYIEENLNSKFGLDNGEGSSEVIKKENLSDNNITDVEFNVLKKFDYNNIIGLLDFNKDLILVYSSYAIYFISKNDYKIKFKLEEYGINGIKICKKINDFKILLYTNNNIIFVDILDNSDYKIEKKIELSYKIYDFKSHLDLLCFKYKDENFNNYYNKFEPIIKLLLFPDYNKSKFSLNISMFNDYSDNDKLNFISNDIFFYISPKELSLYAIKNNKISFEKSLKIDIYPKNISIIELKEYYCLNDKKKILLLNKINLEIAKTISLDSKNIGILKISNKLLSIFISDYYGLFSKNYTISSDGIKWSLNKTKTLLKQFQTFNSCYHDNNYILFMNENSCSLFDIKPNKVN